MVTKRKRKTTNDKTSKNEPPKKRRKIVKNNNNKTVKKKKNVRKASTTKTTPPKSLKKAKFYKEWKNGNNTVMIPYKGQKNVWYRAKILNIKIDKKQTKKLKFIYTVHYPDWGKKYDEDIDELKIKYWNKTNFNKNKIYNKKRQLIKQFIDYNKTNKTNKNKNNKKKTNKQKNKQNDEMKMDDEEEEEEEEEFEEKEEEEEEYDEDIDINEDDEEEPAAEEEEVVDDDDDEDEDMADEEEEEEEEDNKYVVGQHVMHIQKDIGYHGVILKKKQKKNKSYEYYVKYDGYKTKWVHENELVNWSSESFEKFPVYERKKGTRAPTQVDEFIDYNDNSTNDNHKSKRRTVRRRKR